MTQLNGDAEKPKPDKATGLNLTGPEYLSWVKYLLNAGLDFAPLEEAFPEVARQARNFDSASATIYRGQVTIFACKLADGFSYAQVVWHLNHLLALIPRPSALDAVGYYGALVLVFEKGLDTVKRDQIGRASCRERV